MWDKTKNRGLLYNMSFDPRTEQFLKLKFGLKPNDYQWGGIKVCQACGQVQMCGIGCTNPVPLVTSQYFAQQQHVCCKCSSLLFVTVKRTLDELPTYMSIPYIYNHILNMFQLGQLSTVQYLDSGMEVSFVPQNLIQEDLQTARKLYANSKVYLCPISPNVLQHYCDQLHTHFPQLYYYPNSLLFHVNERQQSIYNSLVMELMINHGDQISYNVVNPFCQMQLTEWDVVYVNPSVHGITPTVRNVPNKQNKAIINVLSFIEHDLEPISGEVSYIILPTINLHDSASKPTFNQQNDFTSVISDGNLYLFQPNISQPIIMPIETYFKMVSSSMYLSGGTWYVNTLLKELEGWMVLKVNQITENECADLWTVTGANLMTIQLPLPSVHSNNFSGYLGVHLTDVTLDPQLLKMLVYTNLQSNKSFTELKQRAANYLATRDVNQNISDQHQSCQVHALVSLIITTQKSQQLALFERFIRLTSQFYPLQSLIIKGLNLVQQSVVQCMLELILDSCNINLANLAEQLKFNNQFQVLKNVARHPCWDNVMRLIEQRTYVKSTTIKPVNLEAQCQLHTNFCKHHKLDCHHFGENNCECCGCQSVESHCNCCQPQQTTLTQQ